MYHSVVKMSCIGHAGQSRLNVGCVLRLAHGFYSSPDRVDPENNCLDASSFADSKAVLWCQMMGESVHV